MVAALGKPFHLMLLGQPREHRKLDVRRCYVSSGVSETGYLSVVVTGRVRPSWQTLENKHRLLQSQLKVIESKF